MLLKVVAFTLLGFALLPALIALLFNYGDWEKIGLIFLLGLFFGLVAAPELEPKAFKFPKLFQFLGGLFFGITLSLVINDNIVQTMALGIIGAILGLTASFWLKFLPWP